MNIKKKLLIIFILLFAIITPLIAKAENCDVTKVTLESINLETKTDGVTELEEPSVSGKTINVDLSLSKIGTKQYIK